MREFTPRGEFGLTEVGILALFVMLFLFFCGLLVNFFDPTTDAAKLSNRWSTFMIVGFLYSVIFLILASVMVPLSTGFRYNFYELLRGISSSDKASYVIATLAATLVATSALYWRTYRWFTDLLRTTPGYLYLALITCALINWGILFLVLFVI